MSTAGRLKTAVTGRRRRAATTVPGAALSAAGNDRPSWSEQRDEVARPADRDRRRAERVLEDQVPADDPGDELAQRRVGVGVGGARRPGRWPRTRSSRARRARWSARPATIERTMAGPALAAAAWPVSTKMPVPMMAPTPSMTSCAGPSTRCSPPPPASPSCSCLICSIDLVAKMDMRQRARRRCGVLNPASNGRKKS